METGFRVAVWSPILKQEICDWAMGWKTDQPSVRGQVASALRTDMGS